MKKDINRIAIEMTVRRLLRDIQRSPKRGSRNLIDLMLSFSSSGFQGRLFTLIRDMLRNEDSAYYQLAKNVLASTDLETLTQFGMCVGYNSCTKGSRLIRSLEAEHHFNIPWALTLHIEHPLDRQREAAYASAVAQGMELGIYTYFIHMSGDCSPLLELFRKYTDCAFVLFLDGSVPQDAFLRKMKELHNVMLCVPAGEDAVQVCRILRKERLLYSVYVPYRAQDKERILDGGWLAPSWRPAPFSRCCWQTTAAPRKYSRKSTAMSWPRAKASSTPPSWLITARTCWPSTPSSPTRGAAQVSAATAPWPPRKGSWRIHASTYLKTACATSYLPRGCKISSALPRMTSDVLTRHFLSSSRKASADMLSFPVSHFLIAHTKASR